jgi:hypothetical protein
LAYDFAALTAVRTPAAVLMWFDSDDKKSIMVSELNIYDFKNVLESEKLIDNLLGTQVAFSRCEFVFFLLTQETPFVFLR